MLTYSADHVLPIRLGTSYCYFIPSRRGSILVDAGIINRHQHLQSVLTVHEHDIRDIRYIILTHTHHDHVGSLAEIVRMSGAKVIVHKNEADFLARGRTPLPKGTLAGTRLMVRLGKLLRIGSYPAVQPDFLLNDQLQLSEFGYPLHVFATPGHTNGSISIILDREIALVGDTMFNISPETVYPPFANDEAELMRSWSKLLETPCHTFYPGHGRPIDRTKLERSYEKAIKKIKKRG